MSLIREMNKSYYEEKNRIVWIWGELFEWVGLLPTESTKDITKRRGITILDLRIWTDKKAIYSIAERFLFLFLIREMCIVYYERKIKDVKDVKPRGLLRREKANLHGEEAVNTK